MTELLRQMILKLLTMDDQQTLDKTFEPINYYLAITLIKTMLKKDIHNPRRLNKLYQQLNLSKANEQTSITKNTISLIKQEKEQDRILIHQYFQMTSTIEEVEDNKTDAWTKESIGITSYEYS